MKVTISKISEVKISHLLKTSIENLTKIEAISKTPVNVLMLSKEKKIQLKATALGLAREEEYSKQVGLDGKEDEEESVEEEESDDITDIYKKYGEKK